jgi:hypothetical protein
MIAGVVLLVLLGVTVPWLRVRWAAAEVSRYHARPHFGPSTFALIDDFTVRRNWVGAGAVVGVTRDQEALARPETEQLVRLLAQFPDLDLLDLGGSALVDADFEVFGRMRKLRLLALSGCPVEARQLDRLAGCTQLRTLELAHVSIDQGLINAIGRLQQLERLNLNGSRLTGLDLSPLCQLTNLRLLLLDQTEVTDAEIATLTELTKLDELSLSGNNVSEEAISRLRERVPIENYSDD